jgi:hypothetical protein
LLELQEVTKTVHKIYLHCDVLNAQGYITTIAINIFNPLKLGFEKGNMPLKKNSIHNFGDVYANTSVEFQQQ